MRIAWLCPYPVHYFENELGYKIKRKTHPSSWIVNLSNELAKDDDIELHIITLSPYIKKDSLFNIKNIHYHLIKSFYKIPFLNLGLPGFIPFNYLTSFYFDKVKIDNVLKTIKPDLTHIHGIETKYGLSNYAVNKPHLITVQGISNIVNKNPDNYSMKKANKLELEIVLKYKYFGSRTEFADNYIKGVNNCSEIKFTPEAINEVYFNFIQKTLKPNIAFVGHIMERKGVEVLVEAVKILKKNYTDVFLSLIGSGEKVYTRRISDLIYNSGLQDNIKLLGFKNFNEIKSIYDKTSIFVLPTFIDNSPNSLLEAMASGLISIASNVGGIPSIIKDSENGFLFEAGNSKQLADIIQGVLTNRLNIKGIPENAHEFVKTTYSPSNVKRVFKDVYKNIISYYDYD